MVLAMRFPSSIMVTHFKSNFTRSSDSLHLALSCYALQNLQLPSEFWMHLPWLHASLSDHRAASKIK